MSTPCGTAVWKRAFCFALLAARAFLPVLAFVLVAAAAAVLEARPTAMLFAAARRCPAAARPVAVLAPPAEAGNEAIGAPSPPAPAAAPVYCERVPAPETDCWGIRPLGSWPLRGGAMHALQSGKLDGRHSTPCFEVVGLARVH